MKQKQTAQVVLFVVAAVMAALDDFVMIVVVSVGLVVVPAVLVVSLFVLSVDSDFRLLLGHVQLQRETHRPHLNKNE